MRSLVRSNPILEYQLRPRYGWKKKPGAMTVTVLYMVGCLTSLSVPFLDPKSWCEIRSVGRFGGLCGHEIMRDLWYVSGDYCALLPSFLQCPGESLKFNELSIVK
jgi:hypothetical protein